MIKMRWNGAEIGAAEVPFWGWVILTVRFALAVFLIFIFMFPIVLARLLRVYGFQARIAQLGSQIMLGILGLRLRREGRADPKTSAYVANHSSWLDIFVLFAAAPAQFVAKQEVSKWPGIGILGKLFGTIFIERTRSRADEHVNVLVDRLNKGERLIFFPEGTSTDGLRILTYRSTLFGAFFGNSLSNQVSLQSVYVRYVPAERYDPRIYGLWGQMKFSKSIIAVLSLTQLGLVQVRYGPLRNVRDFDDRKVLAACLEADARALAEPQVANNPA